MSIDSVITILIVKCALWLGARIKNIDCHYCTKNVRKMQLDVDVSTPANIIGLKLALTFDPIVNFDLGPFDPISGTVHNNHL